MSYCRWSCDDFQCDLYIYEDAEGGWTTHVAGNRVTFTEPLPPRPESGDYFGWAQRHSSVSALLATATNAPIGLKHDSKTFNSETLAELEELLLHLRTVGYRFPDYVLDTVREEMAANALTPTTEKETT
jgi:hypothetical protein